MNVSFKAGYPNLNFYTKGFIYMHRIYTKCTVPMYKGPPCLSFKKKRKSLFTSISEFFQDFYIQA